MTSWPRTVGRVLVNPALPLVLWFVFQDSLDLIHELTGISRPAVLLLAYLAACLLWAAVISPAPLRLTSADALVLALLLLIAFSALYDGAELGRFARHAVALTAVPWIAGRLLRPAQVRDFVRYAVFCSLFVLVPAFAYAVLSQQSLERIYLFSDWVFIGVVGLPIAMAVAVCAATILRRDSASPLISPSICWPAIGGGLAIIVYTGARGLMLSLAAVLVVACAAARWHTRRRRTILLVYSAACVVIAFLVLPQARKEHFAELFGLSASIARFHAADALKYNLEALERCNIKQDSIAIRLFLADEALEQLKRAPIFGSGFGRFGLNSCFYGYSAEYASPHSTLLHVAAELGLPGLAIFLALIVLLFRRAANAVASGSLSDTAWTLIAVWALCVVRDQVYGSYLSMPHFYIASALLLTQLQAERNDK